MAQAHGEPAAQREFRVDQENAVRFDPVNSGFDFARIEQRYAFCRPIPATLNQV